MATILPHPAGGRAGAPTSRLRVDPTLCEGVGMCAHLAPGLVGVDSWGYAVPPTEPVSGRDRRAAVTAVKGCPRRALFLD